MLDLVDKVAAFQDLSSTKETQEENHVFGTIINDKELVTVEETKDTKQKY